MSIDWHLTLDAKEVQRWSEALGEQALGQRDQAAAALERGVAPTGPANPPTLLVIGIDGGRYQSRTKDPQSQSRWKEDKVASITSYLPGDGQDKAPVPLVSTLLASTGDSASFGPLVKLEAKARGSDQAQQVIIVSDGAAWIDSINRDCKLADVRIIDFYHAAEHLHAAVAAVCGDDAPAIEPLFHRQRQALLAGQVEALIEWMRQQRGALGEEQRERSEQLRQQIGYFEAHRSGMNYPYYQSRGWPIGSGNIESGVKCVSKRVKGSEQFWHPAQLETILMLRSLWLSQDDRWNRYWTTHAIYRRAA